MEKHYSCPAHWDEEYVVCFLYYLVAESDFPLRAEEVKAINHKIEGLFAYDPFRSANKYIIADDVMRFAQSLRNEQKTEVIKHLAEKFQFPHELFVRAMKDLEEIAVSDGPISIEEHSMMFYIRLQFKKNYSRPEASQYISDNEGFKTRKIGVPIAQSVSGARGIFSAFM